MSPNMMPDRVAVMAPSMVPILERNQIPHMVPNMVPDVIKQPNPFREKNVVTKHANSMLTDDLLEDQITC